MLEQKDTFMDTHQAVVGRILELCQQRNITVNKLCNISGVTQSTVNNLLSGRNDSMTVSTLKKLCDGFEITLGEFFSTPEFDSLEQEIQ